MKFLYGAGSHSQFHQSLSLHSNKKKTFIFIQWNQLWNWWCWLKIYYNSISRQSGIVHKDKAMRQLDLDLWEMNWLVAAARESTNSIIFSLWEWEKRDWIVWFPLAARPLFKNLWFLMKAGCLMDELVAFFEFVGYGRGHPPMLRKEKKTSQPTHSNQTNQRKRENEWRQSKSEFIDGMKELSEINQWTLPLLWRNEWTGLQGQPTARGKPFSNNTISFARAARLKLIELLKWKSCLHFIHQQSKHFWIVDWIEVRERKTNKPNQPFFIHLWEWRLIGLVFLSLIKLISSAGKDNFYF